MNGTVFCRIWSTFRFGCSKHLPRIYLQSVFSKPYLSLTRQTATFEFSSPPLTYKDVKMPETEDERKLVTVDKIPPYYLNAKPPRLMKNLMAIRGPELVHNKLIHKQYGIIALCGGFFKYRHFDVIRQIINKNIDTKRMFAVWRIDPPWKPITKKGIGKRMGGGKGSVDHFATPVKAGRIIVEMGGTIEYEEVFDILQRVVYKLPVDAMVISEKTLDDLHKEEQELQRKNINPFTFQYVVEKNMQGCKSWTSPYDDQWYGQYI